MSTQTKIFFLGFGIIMPLFDIHLIYHLIFYEFCLKCLNESFWSYFIKVVFPLHIIWLYYCISFGNKFCYFNIDWFATFNHFYFISKCSISCLGIHLVRCVPVYHFIWYTFHKRYCSKNERRINFSCQLELLK